MFSRSALGLAAAVALLAACGGKQAPAPAASGSTGMVQATAGCTGALPVTGLCQEAGIGVFGKVGPTAELLDPGCVWKPMEAQRSPDEVLVFRGQDCSGAKFDPVSFRFPTPGELHAITAASAGQPGYDDVIAVVFDVPAGKTAEEVAAATLAETPEKERATCAPQPSGTASDDKPVAGRAFQLKPDEATMAALHKSDDGPVSVCGRYGFAEGSQELWEGRSAYAIYHMMGQDTPSWDPMSFTFYRRNASGAWIKQPN